MLLRGLLDCFDGFLLVEEVSLVRIEVEGNFWLVYATLEVSSVIPKTTIFNVLLFSMYSLLEA